jgi:hypothetical protein
VLEQLALALGKTKETLQIYECVDIFAPVPPICRFCSPLRHACWQFVVEFVANSHAWCLQSQGQPKQRSMAKVHVQATSCKCQCLPPHRVSDSVHHQPCSAIQMSVLFALLIARLQLVWFCNAVLIFAPAGSKTSSESADSRTCTTCARTFTPKSRRSQPQNTIF